MKAFYLLGAGLFVSGMLAACGGGGNNSSEGIKFAPEEKVSELSESERREAIAEKSKALNVSFDSIIGLNGITFSVLPPSTGNGITEEASERLATKLIQIAAGNGIGGLAVNPVLGLVTEATRTESSVTSTAPQKTIVKYDLTMYCGNFVSNDIYASATVPVTGVGADPDAATLQAFNSLKDSSDMKEMFRKASGRAMDWYNSQGNLTMALDNLLAEGKYGVAMALLSSVPATASTYQYALKRNGEVSAIFFQTKADELYGRMKAAIAAANGKYNPEAGACYSLIPHSAKIWGEADKVFSTYCKAIDSDRHDSIARTHAVEDRNAINAHLLEMERLQVEKIKAPFEIQATIAQIKADARVKVAEANAEGKKNANTGGFLGFGKLWDGSFGLANRIMDQFDD